MDKIVEILVKKENTLLNILIKCALWGFSFALAAVCLFAVKSIGVVLCVAVIYAAYKISQKFDVEFEYIYVNGDLDIDRIFSRNSRKRYLSIELARIVAIGSVENENIKKLSYNAKVIDASSGVSEDPYAIIYNSPKGRVKVIVENNEIIDMYKNLIADKVF